MASRIRPMLMFEGRAEEAMRFYVELFDDAEIERVERYEADPGAGMVRHATLRLGQDRIECIDSPIEHGFTFTPALSIVVECDEAGRVDELFERLGEGGSTLMPLAEYPFAKRFAWVSDRFGVSWQLRFSGE